MLEPSKENRWDLKDVDNRYPKETGHSAQWITKVSISNFNSVNVEFSTFVNLSQKLFIIIIL